MALNGTGIEFGKSEHVFRWRISRATTISADFIVLGQRCGVQVFPQKVYRVKRLYPVLESRSVGEFVMSKVSSWIILWRLYTWVMTCAYRRLYRTFNIAHWHTSPPSA
jgi:hypothetical protein